MPKRKNATDAGAAAATASASATPTAAVPTPNGGHDRASNHQPLKKLHTETSNTVAAAAAAVATAVDTKSSNHLTPIAGGAAVGRAASPIPHTSSADAAAAAAVTTTTTTTTTTGLYPANGTAALTAAHKLSPLSVAPMHGAATAATAATGTGTGSNKSPLSGSVPVSGLVLCQDSGGACQHCGQRATHLCSQCRMVYYCHANCQSKHAIEHAGMCRVFGGLGSASASLARAISIDHDL